LRLTLRNFGATRIDTEVEIGLGADFADMFEVRGAAVRQHRGQILAPKRTSCGPSAFAYVGEDEQFRRGPR
jgi:glycogen debranching enzyme